jgi:cytochrome c biogenesis factor
VVLQRLPFIVALGGAAVARSGAATSVHSFAEEGRIGTMLGLLALVAAVVSLRGLAALPSARRLDGWRLTPTILIGASLAIVTMLTITPLIGSGERDGARIAGTYFARALAPFAAVAVISLVVLAVRARRHVPVAAWVAHVGIVVLLLGIVASGFDRAERVRLPTGSTAEVAGATVTNRGVDVRDGPYAGTSAVVATLDVNGARRQPSLVAYPERGGVLAETSLVSRPWRDVQVVLLSADDAGEVLLEVRSKPFVELIWIGSLTVMVGAALSLRRRHPAGPPVDRASGSTARSPSRRQPAAVQHAVQASGPSPVEAPVSAPPAREST